ncbi:MAG: hypothetical protein AB1679_34290 [Actinomycetota bacterium]
MNGGHRWGSGHPPRLDRRHRWLVRLVGRVYSRWAGRYDPVVTRRLLPLILPGGRDALAHWLDGERPIPPVSGSRPKPPVTATTRRWPWS